MVINNNLDKAFGLVGTAAGTVLFVVGIITSFYNLSGLFFVLVGAFVGFTSTSTMVDLDRKRIKFSNNLFGFISMGKWIAIQPEMKLGLIKSKRITRAYSQSNRFFEEEKKDIRLFLLGADSKRIVPIKKYDSLEIAQTEMEELHNQFGIDLV